MSGARELQHAELCRGGFEARGRLPLPLRPKATRQFVPQHNPEAPPATTAATAAASTAALSTAPCSTSIHAERVFSGRAPLGWLCAASRRFASTRHGSRDCASSRESSGFARWSPGEAADRESGTSSSAGSGCTGASPSSSGTGACTGAGPCTSAGAATGSAAAGLGFVVDFSAGGRSSGNTARGRRGLEEPHGSPRVFGCRGLVEMAEKGR